MAFSTGFGAGYGIGSDIAAKRLAKKEKERAKKLTEELQAKIEAIQTSGVEPSYYEKLELGVLASQIGETMAKTVGDINAAQSNLDIKKVGEAGANLRNINDNLTVLIKEIGENPTTFGAVNLKILDDITGKNISQYINKEAIDNIGKKKEQSTAIEQGIDVMGKLPEEYRMAYGEQAGVVPAGLQATPKEPTALSAKDNWAIENYKTGKINFDQLSKYMGTYITPEGSSGKSAKEKEVELAKQYGATNEEIKNVLIGRSNTPKAGQTGAGGVTAQDFLFGDEIAGGNIFAGIDMNNLTEEDKTSIRNYYNLNKSFIDPSELPQVEAYLQQLGVNLNPPAPEPEPTTEELPTEAPQPGLLQKAGNFIKNTWQKATAPGGTPAYQGKSGKDQYGYTIGEQKDVNGKIYKYIGDNQWELIS